MRALGLRVPLLVIVLAGAVLLARVLVDSLSSPDHTRPSSARTYPDFTVTTASGTLALSDLRGKAVVVYFGYTACPDVCPTTLATLGAAFRELDEPTRALATALFVSVDPERDTPERLDAYVGYFHPSFIGGTATLPVLREVAEAWGVAFRKVEDSGSALRYMVDHTTQAFLVGPDGRMVEELAYGMPARSVARSIRRALGKES